MGEARSEIPGFDLVAEIGDKVEIRNFAQDGDGPDARNRVVIGDDDASLRPSLEFAPPSLRAIAWLGRTNHQRLRF